MQFIERSSFNLRSAIYRLNHPKAKMIIMLFPMIHVGTTEFYKAINNRILKCDSIIYEGVTSSKGNFLTLSYRIFGYWNKIGLIVQSKSILFDGYQGSIIHGDIGSDIFDANWSALPFKFRLLLILLVPFVAIHRLIYGNRESIARGLEVNDLPSRSDILNANDNTDAFKDVILTSRDKHLISVIERIFNQKKDSSETVGIVYGAAHIPKVTRYLMDNLGYKINSSEWITVFDL